MEFSIRFTEEGRRTLHSLHIENQKEIKKSLKMLSKDIGLGKSLIGSLIGYYSLHVGNYRVIYSVSDFVILVHYAGHRRNAYGNAGALC